MLNKNKFDKLFGLGNLPGIKPVFYIIIFLFPIKGNTQNLVPNGDFEEYITCPDVDPPYYYIDRAKHWFMPSTGSSDYFNSCSSHFNDILNTYSFSVPQNYIGYQEARSGDGYGGYYAVLLPLDDGYHEYLSARLLQALEKGKLYQLTYYVSLADSMSTGDKPQQFINHSGAYFSDIPINKSNFYRIDENPQVFSDPSTFLDDSLGWQKVTGTFEAKGGEEFITIGCFFKYLDISFNFHLGSDHFIQPYYYIDDVQLIEINFDFPNVITPDNDGINDIAFQFSGYNFEISILNRWGNLVAVVNTDNGWAGIDMNGSELSVGVYFYIVKNKNKDYIKTGFIHLVR